MFLTGRAPVFTPTPMAGVTAALPSLKGWDGARLVGEVAPAVPARLVATAEDGGISLSVGDVGG